MAAPSAIEAFWAQQRREARREAEHHAAGDFRARCAQKDHLLCGGCGECACVNTSDDPGDWFVKVTTDKQGRTLCRECRYEADAPWNR